MTFIKNSPLTASTVLAGTLTLLTHLSLFAEEKKEAEASKPTPDPLVMFDGKSLDGWEETDFAGRGEVTVEDGKLILGSGFMTGVTTTKEVPKNNYEVNLDAMRVDGSDFFCGLTTPYNDSHFSFVVGGWGGGVVGISSVDGFDASENETTSYHRIESKKWYHVRLRVTDTKIEAWLDEEQVVDLETKQRKFSLRMEVDPSMPFGIATYATTAALKNITIKKLKKD